MTTPDAAELVGAVVDGRYRIDRVIATGGMATVYQGVDQRLDRPVAIKVMLPAYAADPNFVRRFEREARSAARLNHDGIVAVYDQGSWLSPQGRQLVYLVMEFVDGTTLRQSLSQRGRYQPDAALAVMEPVLEALAAAHDAGYAHRDIKPENVLIDCRGRVKIADFGVARALTSSTGAGSQTSAIVIGTVAYLAPEVLSTGESDARTDVYSAGIVLYELLTGSVPYHGENAMAVAYQHVNSNVSPPSRTVPGLGPGLDELVATATATNPDDRYADAHDFLNHMRIVRAEGHAEPAEHRTVVLPAPTAHVSPTNREPATSPPSPTAQTAPIDVIDLSGDDPQSRATLPESDDQEHLTGSPVLAPRGYWPGRALIAALVCCALVVGAGFAAYGYAVAQTATVPDVSGLNRAAAEQTLVSSDLELNVVGREHSESVARNAIISMEPAPGSTVTKGTLVSVIVSAGPPFVKVPKVVGESRSRAQQRLTDRQLRFDVREDYSDTVPAGSVISVTPATGERVRIGSTVTVTVSRGPAPVTVPDVVAMDRDSAISRLESLGLRVAVRNQLPLVVVGRVYSQDPAPGTVIPRGSTVTITLV